MCMTTSPNVLERLKLLRFIGIGLKSQGLLNFYLKEVEDDQEINLFFTFPVP